MAPYVQGTDLKGIHCFSITSYFTPVFNDNELLLRLGDIASIKKVLSVLAFYHFAPTSSNNPSGPCELKNCFVSLVPPIIYQHLPYQTLSQKANKKAKTKTYNSQYSLVVTHPTTNWPLTRFSWPIGREAELSGCYGRM